MATGPGAGGRAARSPALRGGLRATWGCCAVSPPCGQSACSFLAGLAGTEPRSPEVTEYAGGKGSCWWTGLYSYNMKDRNIPSPVWISGVASVGLEACTVELAFHCTPELLVGYCCQPCGGPGDPLPEVRTRKTSQSSPNARGSQQAWPGHDVLPLPPLSLVCLQLPRMQSSCAQARVPRQSVLGSTVIPRKPLESHFFQVASFHCKNSWFCIQNQKENKLWKEEAAAGVASTEGGDLSVHPAQHRGWEGSTGPGSRARVPFSCLGEAPAGECSPPQGEGAVAGDRGCSPGISSCSGARNGGGCSGKATGQLAM